MSLPFVKPENAFPLAKELKESEYKEIEYIKKQLKEIKEENPIVSMWIKRHAQTSKDKITAAYCGIMVYRLLKSQAEADEMNELFK